MSVYNISFILHKPQLSENIGACARGMKNFNFQKLVVVDPKPIFPNDKILATSVGAKNIINKTKNYENLEKSLKNIDIPLEICVFCGWGKKSVNISLEICVFPDDRVIFHWFYRQN